MASPSQKPDKNYLQESTQKDSFAATLSIDTAPKPTLITISGEEAFPKEADAPVGGRVQFQNDDNQGYLIRIQNIVTLDHYLPAFGTITVFVNEHAEPGSEIIYKLSVAKTPPGGRGHLAFLDLAASQTDAPTADDAPKLAFRFASYTAPGGKIIIHP
jgi:hypothetical protein